jgi:broad specificity phosphatase PhoE
MNVYVIRHGETNYTIESRHNSDPTIDVHLTAEGIEQANKVAHYFKDLPVDRIFISELRRTKQTADIINKFHTAPITVDARLNDNRSGFEGQVDDLYEKAMRHISDRWTAKFNDGESLHNVQLRVKSFITDLEKQHFTNPLIVTSRTIVQMFNICVNKLPVGDFDSIYIQTGEWITLTIPKH